MYKICKWCKKEFPENIKFFKPNKNLKNGFSNVCRKCYNKYSADRRRGNQEYLKKRREDYQKRYGVINREKEKQRKLKYPIRCRAQLLRKGMTARSQKLNIPFDKDFFTVEYLMGLIEDKPFCECCGKKLDIGFKLNKQKNDNSPSMDRKIPIKGYTKENTALLCWRCNCLKRDATVEELDRIVKWMSSWGNQL